MSTRITYTVLENASAEKKFCSTEILADVMVLTRARLKRYTCDSEVINI